MTTKQTDDRTSPTAAEAGETTHSVQAPHQRRSWQTNIPSLLSLTCGSLGLVVFLCVRGPEPCPGDVALPIFIVLASLGVPAILLGVAGVIVSRSLALRVLAIMGALGGIVPANVGLFGLLLIRAMP